jgi:hypothetical protein
MTKAMEARSETPWMDWMKERKGWHERTHNKRLSKYWKYTSLPHYDSVIGRRFAWCKMTVNAALAETGYEYNKSAAAKRGADMGTPCDLKYGAIVVIRHDNGGHHITFFAGWADEKKRLMYGFGGNQANALKISVYDVSGNKRGHDEIVAIRWPVKSSRKAA